MLKMLFINYFIRWVIVISVVDGKSGISFNQPKFGSFASWNSEAETIVKINDIGYEPYGMFININNTLYVAAQSKNEVKMWLNGIGAPLNVISAGLFFPTSLFVTITGDIYIDNGQLHNTVSKWSLSTEKLSPVMNVATHCTGLFIDMNNTLYCSMRTVHQVVKKSLSINVTTPSIAAGTGMSGSNANMLDWPYGIFVDIKLNLYVADCNNNRIQRFKPNQLNGTTVVGSEVTGTITLTCPTWIAFDADGYMFITDGGKNRIIGSGPQGFRCLVGCSTESGSKSSQLHGPRTLNFDIYGNIFVVDRSNHRIQKFNLTRNYSIVSYNRPQLCLDAKWEKDAQKIADQSNVGFKPYGIFVDASNTIYASNRENGSIQIWSEGTTKPTRTVSTATHPHSIFMTIDGNLIIGTNQSIQQQNWSPNGTKNTIILQFNKSCFGIFVDINNTLYCSIKNSHKVVTTSLNNNENIWQIVAGNGKPSSESNTLNEPHGIFVDINFNLYLADCRNNRIQRFYFDDRNGITEEINGDTESIELKCPTGVVLDANDYLFIVDSGNHRIIGSGFKGFRCLVGCKQGTGPPRQRLNNPSTMSFDSDANIFVVDTNENQIVKFNVEENKCNGYQPPRNISKPRTTTTTTIKTSTNIVPSTHLTEFISTTSFSTEFQPKDKLTSKSFLHDTTIFDPLTSITTLETTTMVDINILTSVPMKTPSNFFEPLSCPNSTNIGINCNISNHRCEMIKLCQNNGTCYYNHTNSDDYICSCSFGFYGENCQYTNKSCENHICLNNGICFETSDGELKCQCKDGWDGDHCQLKINYCQNHQCQNEAVCKSESLNYTCHCLSESYSGQYCQIISKKILVLKIVSKSFAYIAIIAILTVVIFIIVMDILKYCFGIDPVEQDRRFIRRQRYKKRRKKPVIQRFIYVNAPSSNVILTNNETNI